MNSWPKHAALAWFFVFTYFFGATISVWVYVLNPDAAADQTVDEILLRATALLSLFPIAFCLLLGAPRLRADIDMIMRTLPAVASLPLVALVTATVGIIRGNDFAFILGDTYKLLTLPLGVLAGLRLPLGPAMQACVAFGIANAALFLFGTLPARIWGDLSIVGIGTYHLLAPLCFIPAMKPQSQWSRIATVTLVLTATTIGLKRATILLFPFALFALGVAERGMRAALVVLLIGVSAIGIYYYDEATAVRDLFTRLSDTYQYGEFDSSTGSRLQEVVSSWNYLNRTAELGAVQIAAFGLGSGATYVLDDEELRLNPIAPNSQEVHNIHFTPMTLVFRCGLIPAALILTAYASCLIYCFQLWRRSRSVQTRKAAYSVFMYGLVLAAASASGFVIVGDILLPVILGALIRRATVENCTPFHRATGIHSHTVIAEAL